MDEEGEHMLIEDQLIRQEAFTTTEKELLIISKPIEKQLFI